MEPRLNGKNLFYQPITTFTNPEQPVEIKCDFDEDIFRAKCLGICDTHAAITSKKEVVNIKDYIINENATVIFWEDGTKTVVKKTKEDKFDKRLGLLIGYFQKNCGMSKTKANKFLDNLIVTEKTKKEK